MLGDTGNLVTYAILEELDVQCGLNRLEELPCDSSRDEIKEESNGPWPPPPTIQFLSVILLLFGLHQSKINELTVVYAP